MAATKTKGGKGPVKRRTTRGRRRNKGLLDRFFAMLPFTEPQLRRAGTVAIIALILAGAGVAASYAGVPAMAGDRIDHFAGQAGYKVKRIEVRGVDRMDEFKVYDVVLDQKNRAMPSVDIAALRKELTAFGWIADARVSRQLPDTLVIDIVEHEPAAVWEGGEGQMLVNGKGETIVPIRPDAEPELVRISGEGGRKKIDDLLELLGRAPALKPMIVRAEWVGNRRWNLTFDSGELLALPEGGDLERKALLDFARMDGISRLLGTGITFFDMRDPTRAYFRKPRQADTRFADAGGEGGVH